MGKLPSFQFYPCDWQKDPALRRCSHAAKGVYIDMLCLMFESSERGVLATAGVPWPDDEVARAVGGDQQQTLSYIRELVDKGVVSRSETGAIYCRRMVRDEHKRRKCSEAGKRGGGNPHLTYKGPDKGGGGGALKGSPEDEDEEEVNTGQVVQSAYASTAPIDSSSFDPREREFLHLWKHTPGVSQQTSSGLSYVRRRQLSDRMGDPEWFAAARSSLAKFPLRFFASQGQVVGMGKFLEPGFVESVLEGRYDHDWKRANGHSETAARHAAGVFEPGRNYAGKGF